MITEAGNSMGRGSSPAGFHLIPSWLTTDSVPLSPLSLFHPVFLSLFPSPAKLVASLRDPLLSSNVISLSILPLLSHPLRLLSIHLSVACNGCKYHPFSPSLSLSRYPDYPGTRMPGSFRMRASCSYALFSIVTRLVTFYFIHRTR